MIALRTVVLLLLVAPCLAAPVVVEDPARFQSGVEAALQVLTKGDPIRASTLAGLVGTARRNPSVAKASLGVQQALDGSTQLEVEINPESRVKVAPGAAGSELIDSKWNYRLVKIVNLARVTAPLRISSAQSRGPNETPSRDCWLDLELFGGDDEVAPLTGATVEYRVMRLRPHAVGKRAAVIAIDVGQGTADMGFRNDVLLTFKCSRGDP